MKYRNTRRAVLLAGIGALVRAMDPFRDPAPPAVQTLAAMNPPQARECPESKFHIAPKPLAAGAVTEDWPSFLGPTHNGYSRETKLLHQWPANGPALVWEFRKGTGYSSPAIAGRRLVYLHRTGNTERVECLDADTGAKYWDFAYATQFEDRYGYNNGPRASPVIDGGRVYTYGAEGKLHCFKLDTGQLYWKRDIAAEFKVPQDFFGVATNPLIDGERLILNVGAPKGPCVAAFDKATGRMLWGAGDQWGASYATPVPAVVRGKRRVFVFAGGESQPPKGGLLSIDPADGSIDFAYPWRSRSYESVNASSPVVVGDQVFISASYRTGSAMLNIDERMQPAVAWTTTEVGTHFNTALEKDGYLYAFEGRNEPDASLVCVDVKTGKVVWRSNPEWDEVIGNVTRRLGTYRGTLLHVDGGFLCLGELGHLLWLDLSPKGWKEIVRTRLFLARETWSAPVISRGLLYVSQHGRDFASGSAPRLLCYDLRGR